MILVAMAELAETKLLVDRIKLRVAERKCSAYALSTAQYGLHHSKGVWNNLT